MDKRIINLKTELEKLTAQIQQLNVQQSEQNIGIDDLKRSIASNGGDRLERLTIEIKQKEKERDSRREKAQRYQKLLAVISEISPENEVDFLSQRTRLTALKETITHRYADLQNELIEQSSNLRTGKDEHTLLQAEIDSLKTRRSNIDGQQIKIRAHLCQALGIADEQLPFAGELIQVREDEADWEGAAERLLRSFGLSLLIPDDYYPKVVAWVDQNHLKGRLVYFQVRPPRGTELPGLHRDSLRHKLLVKSDSPFYDWLDRELAVRFNVACCETEEQFRRESRAITQAGQIKDSTGRHEKDDRHLISDRSRYVLGWTNAAKIADLEHKARQLEIRLGEMGSLIGKIQSEQRSLTTQLDALNRCEEFTHFLELDWAERVTEIERLIVERQKLEAASDKLKQLNAELSQRQQQLQVTKTALDQKNKDFGAFQTRYDIAQELHKQTHNIHNSVSSTLLSEATPQLERIRAEALGEHQISVESCENREQELRNWLQTHITAEDQKLKRLNEKIIRAMMAFKEQFKLETAEFDASLEAAFEYKNLLDKLGKDDLPRFEARFKELLNVNTINEIANFNAQLARERETIKERIARINESLTKIDYNPNRYIVLESQTTPDSDIRDFQTELRSCTEGSLTGSEDTQYSEAKFLQVKQIIDRFRGREGYSEMDKRWTLKVTDVRNWFLFAASERWRADDSEYEHYSDSGGKSGGQKEKLAYTILAASLAYQFGLEWGAVRSRSFRFVVIDEAFGRGSDESAQYGLRLFSQLNLQLLIVTPLQKIHIIELFVASVSFVQNEDGSASKLQNLSIEAYREDKLKRMQ